MREFDNDRPEGGIGGARGLVLTDDTGRTERIEYL
jgi:hypothetical protein